jgi:6,7-dimethyl-8-ribityllumazine synthase
MGIDYQPDQRSSASPWQYSEYLKMPQIHEASVVIVASRFNARVVDRLVQGALEVLSGAGFKPDQIGLVEVPGAFEIPLAVQAVFFQHQSRNRVQGVVALGAVIRGETPHFDYVASTAQQGILEVSLKCHKPVGFGILTVNTIEQALARAGGALGNVGAQATQALLMMRELITPHAILEQSLI